MDTNTIDIALAQIPVKKGQIATNLTEHLAAIAAAAQQQVDLVVFPELSLTGYELELLATLAMTEESDAIQALKTAAQKYAIWVIAGCPLACPNDKPAIAAVVCSPQGDVHFCTKQYLHPGEDVFCSAGSQNHTLNIQGFTLALAICADFSKPQHARDANQQKADVYVVSALISPAGYETDASILADIASSYNMPVLLANHISVTGGWQTCGKSTMWLPSGEPVAALMNEPGLIVCRIASDGSHGVVTCDADSE
ncbi:carbon-nitrogen hydrolase family protein [Vibrio proteolyticus]